MRGHDVILAMRRRGVRPASVWLVDAPPHKPLADGTRLDWWAFGKALRNLPPAEVSIDPTDYPARADLRFLVGMTVHVMLDDPDRMRAFVQACRDAGAAKVFGASHTYDPKRMVATEVAFVEG